MFGQNNNDSQAQNNAGVPAAPPMPANPFSETDTPVPPADNPTQVVAPSSTPVTPPVSPPVPDAVSPTTPDPVATPPAGGDDLLGLKQQALQSLQPLVSHLQQTPEEKFKTTMMLIQATDNPSLVKQAYEAASQIPDENARAQALLDVVNEINYFTHKDKEN